MKKIFITFAIIISGIAVVLAMDFGRLAFTHVDVEGHQMRMLISGHGGPAVVFETGGSPGTGGPLESWQRVQPGVSKFTLTVAYDRAGNGLSAPGPKPRDARQVARELHLALQQAHVPPPYILVGHSFGGPLIRVFAGMYPNDVCGMVLADPTQEEAIAWALARETNHIERQDEEWKDIQASLAEAHESAVPRDIPVVLITALGPRVFPDWVTEAEIKKHNESKQPWLKFHSEWVEKLPKGRHIITEDSSHMVPFEQPELIVQTIREMVEQNAKKP